MAKESLNKGTLISEVHRILGDDVKSKAAAERAVNAVLDTITDAIAEGREVRIDKFGFFKITPTAARKARNPQTGAELDVPASQKVKFTPSAYMKDVAARAPLD